MITVVGVQAQDPAGGICSPCEKEAPLHLLALLPLLEPRDYAHSGFSGRVSWVGSRRQKLEQGLDRRQDSARPRGSPSGTALVGPVGCRELEGAAGR